MASPRFFTLVRHTALALAAASLAQAGGAVPWFSRGAGVVHGYRGGSFYRGPGRSVGFYGGYRAYGGGLVHALPMGYASYRYGNASWFFGGGYWYRPWGSGFASFYPPVGLCLPVLPLGYSVYTFGGVPYYWYQDVYYTQAPAGGYVVAEPPPLVDEGRQLPAPSRPSVGRSSEAAGDALLIIPKEGQNEQRMVADRQAAQRYAVDESGYDPACSDPTDPGTARARRAYFRAMRSYLEERGYSVK